jgi:hypothetical protein
VVVCLCPAVQEGGQGRLCGVECDVEGDCRI